jgi:membrane protease YdiL (CAAX protease family)
MIDIPASLGESAALDSALTTSTNPKRQRWFELGLVLLIAFLTPIFNSLYFFQRGTALQLGQGNSRWIFGLIHETTCLLLLGYVLSRRALRFRDLGLRWSLRRFGAGLLLGVGAYISIEVGALLLQIPHAFIYGSRVTGHNASDFFAHRGLMIIPFMFLNPLFEELIVRAYLMTEVIELLSSRVLAILLSVALQFSYHLYYGWYGAASVSCAFLLLSLYYARTRQALPIVVAHGLIDVFGLIRLL